MRMTHSEEVLCKSVFSLFQLRQQLQQPQNRGAADAATRMIS